MTKKEDRLNTHGSKADWREKLKAMTDEELYAHCEQHVWLSAYASNNPRSDYHFLCDAGYDECVRRGKADIYTRAHRAAAASAGC